MVTFTKREEEFELIPEGIHTAILYKIMYIGHQEVPVWENSKKTDKTKLTPQLMFCFEFPDAKMEDGRPFSLWGKTQTVSAHIKANLPPLLKSLNGGIFSDEQLGSLISGQDSFSQFLGKVCKATVSRYKKQDGSDGASIDSIFPYTDSAEVPDCHNQKIFLDVDDLNQELFDAQPEWLQKKIMASEEMSPPSKKEQVRGGIEPDDIPF